MNLKLLEKLVRLANNNPNDNEANLAARRVCKMIEEGKFEFVGDVVQSPNNQSNNQSRPTTWNDIRRSSEPEFSSRKPNSAGNSWRNSNIDFNDLVNDLFRGSPFYQNTQNESQQKRRTNQPESYEYEPVLNNQKEKRPKIKVKCKECGLEVERTYSEKININDYACTICAWQKYNNPSFSK